MNNNVGMTIVKRRSQDCFNQEYIICVLLTLPAHISVTECKTLWASLHWLLYLLQHKCDACCSILHHCMHSLS